MKFDLLDSTMRLYEKGGDIIIPPSFYIVARLDGKGFTKLTAKQNLRKPFDDNFHQYMITVTKNIMTNYGLSFSYGYTQSDEISLLFKINENIFNRRSNKLSSVLSGICSSEFTYEAKIKASFDCKLSILPSKELVQDYFNWRKEDATRNCINAYSYWMLRQSNLSPSKCNSLLLGLNKFKKLEIIESKGFNFNNIPKWQKEGQGFFFQSFMKEGYNPILKETTLVSRKKLVDDFNIDFDFVTMNNGNFMNWLLRYE